MPIYYKCSNHMPLIIYYALNKKNGLIIKSDRSIRLHHVQNASMLSIFQSGIASNATPSGTVSSLTITRLMA